MIMDKNQGISLAGFEGRGLEETSLGGKNDLFLPNILNLPNLPLI